LKTLTGPRLLFPRKRGVGGRGVGWPNATCQGVKIKKFRQRFNNNLASFLMLEMNNSFKMPPAQDNCPCPKENGSPGGGTVL